MSGDIFGGVGNAVNKAVGGLFGTEQGSVPYNNQFSNTSSSTPAAFAMPYLNQGLSQAQSIYNANQTPSLDTFNAGQSNLQDTLAGKYLSPDSNPYLQASVSDALGQAKSAFAGQYGGAAGQNLDNSGYQEALARGLGGVATNAYSNAYGQERQNQMNAAGMVPAFSTFAAQQPYMGLQNYMSAISPALQFGTQTNSGTQQNQQPFYQNNTATTLGALAGGAALAKMSDIRLKSNIVKVGEHPRGFGIYEYNIFGRRQRGVIAQEVEKIIPEAVSEHLGMKMVDYARLG
jgi:hypothetical protein